MFLDNVNLSNCLAIEEDVKAGEHEKVGCSQEGLLVQGKNSGSKYLQVFIKLSAGSLFFGCKSP
jgi:hypothetical protein